MFTLLFYFMFFVRVFCRAGGVAASAGCPSCRFLRWCTGSRTPSSAVSLSRVTRWRAPLLFVVIFVGVSVGGDDGGGRGRKWPVKLVRRLFSNALKLSPLPGKAFARKESVVQRHCPEGGLDDLNALKKLQLGMVLTKRVNPHCTVRYGSAIIL